MSWYRLRVITWGVAMLAAIAGCNQDSADGEKRAAKPARRSTVAVFHPDPEHAWNRLYSALYLRRAADAREFGQDEIDPLLWPDSKHLIQGKSHQDALRELDEFLARNSADQIHDPVKRAVLQHDLWAVFDWLAARPPEEQAAARELTTRLAQVLRRLALTREEIARLPDNYAAAVASRAAATEYNPEQPRAPFLPARLLDRNGPWVEVAVAAVSATPMHVEFVGARSEFQVILRLPGGRQATEVYLQRLRAAQERRTPEEEDSLPQFPPGTQVALTRRMMVFDREGNLVPTSLIETVQLRVCREVPKTLARLVERAKTEQDFFEFELHREDLLAGRAGGLRLVGDEERRLVTFGVSMRHVFTDPFRDRRELQGENPIRTCPICHAGSGIYSVMSFARRPVYVRGPEDRSAAATYLKRQRYDWGLLNGMWAASP